jgi:hypothetical protein
MTLPMPKIIKKIIRYLIVLVAVVITVPSVGILMMRTPKFQTFVVHRFTSFISKKLGTNISVGNVSYTYFNKLVVYDVVIEDQNHDTLVAAQQIAIKIKDFNPAKNIYKFGKVDIYQPDFRMITDTSGIMNLRWYLDILSGDKTKDSTNNVLVSFADIDIYDGRYQLKNERNKTVKKPGLIDFSDLKVKSISGKIEDFLINSDSVSFTLNNISFAESTGMISQNLDLKAIIKNEDLYFNDIRMLTDSSIINATSIDLLPMDSVGFNDFINKVRLNISLERSIIKSSDLAYFVSFFNGMHDQFYISGDFTGTVAEMNGRKIELEYASDTRLKCDFDISGLPNLDNTFAFVEVNDFRTTAKDIERFKRPGVKDISLPKIVHDLGRMTYRGNFTGFTTDFVSYGTLNTEKGSFTTDVSFRPDSINLFRFKGLLKARDIDLGTLTGNNKLLDKLWFHADVDGYSSSFKHFFANIIGVVDSVGINNYIYRDISLNGQVTENAWDGKVDIRDRNIKMGILGRFDFSGLLPEMDFTMNLAEADLYKLNIEKQDTLFKATALLTASFKGNNIDNLDGEMRLINSTMKNSSGDISIYDFLIRSTAEKGIPLLTLRSDFADAEVRGPHNYASIGIAVKSVLSHLFPTNFKPPVSSVKIQKNNFTYNASFKNIDKLNKFFGTGISVADSSKLNGIFQADSSKITMNFRSRQFGLKGNYLNNLNAKATITGDKMNINVFSDEIQLLDNSDIKNVSIALNSHPDTLDLDISWNNHNEGKTRGDIRAAGYIGMNENNIPALTVKILPTEAFVNSAIWKINPATIRFDSISTHFDNIFVNNNSNFFRLDGSISSNSRDKLTFSFDGLNLSYINELSERKASGKAEEGMEMTLEGRLKGNIEISDIKKGLRLESDINIDGFSFNGSPYGQVTVKSNWDSHLKAIVIDVVNDYEGAKFFDISGTYKPSGNVFNITASVFRLPLNVINPIIKSFASDIRGLGSGKINLRGKINQPMLTGAIKAEEASLKIDFLQTRYSFNDSVWFTKKGIEFRNIKVLDERKNQGTFNGILAHTGFKDIHLDLTCNIKKFMVLNRPEGSDYFYGPAFATGIVTIKGPTNRLMFNISARTDPNTKFYVPLNSGATVSDYPYILFIDTKQEAQTAIAQEKMFVKKENSSGINLNFDLEVTPDAQVQLIMDPKTNDIIKGKGSGNLNISINSKGDIKMAGDYVIQEGNYLFTLGNFINKPFSIEEGGTITWNGGLTDADLNLKAIYKTTASLNDIYPDEALQKRIDVECQLNLSGKLFSPVVSLNVDSPKSDEETREYIRMATSTEEQLYKQFLYLVVMRRFYPDPSFYKASSISSTQGASSLGVTTTTEMLSNQLSNWLSQISNDFDIGFNYNPGDEMTTQEVEAAFSTQLLNDKVTLNGNVDVGGKQSNTSASNITTDFTLEWKITDKFKFKAFNRANDNLLYEISPNTQGFGLLYRHEFNKLSDLFKKKDANNKKGSKVVEKP